MSGKARGTFMNCHLSDISKSSKLFEHQGLLINQNCERWRNHIWLLGFPNPNKMEQSWECTFSKLFGMKTKLGWKKFHHWTSELKANMHGQSVPSRLDWPSTLAGTSEVQWWNLFWWSFCIHIGRSFKKVHSQLCFILWGLGEPSSHMWNLLWLEFYRKF